MLVMNYDVKVPRTSSHSYISPTGDDIDLVRRYASWLKKPVNDVREPSSRYYNLYTRSGQNEPDRFQKITLEFEQRERIFVAEDNQNKAVLGDDELEIQTAFPKLSPFGRRCLVTFHISRVSNRGAD